MAQNKNFTSYFCFGSNKSRRLLIYTNIKNVPEVWHRKSYTSYFCFFASGVIYSGYWIPHKHKTCVEWQSTRDFAFLICKTSAEFEI